MRAKLRKPSLATQTRVLFILRTMGNPFRSRPSLPLAVSTVVIGILLPISPVAGILDFATLPVPVFTFLAGPTLHFYAERFALHLKRSAQERNPLPLHGDPARAGMTRITASSDLAHSFETFQRSTNKA